jgi:hypothetical protein
MSEPTLVNPDDESGSGEKKLSFLSMPLFPGMAEPAARQWCDTHSVTYIKDHLYVCMKRPGRPDEFEKNITLNLARYCFDKMYTRL